jgi:multidrug efflux pump subunit AcrB
MISERDSNGLITLLVCAIALVLGGVGLSLLADARIDASRERLAVERDVEADSNRIQTLRLMLERQRLEWSTLMASRGQIGQALALERQRAGSLSARRQSLERSVVQVSHELERLERECDRARQSAVARSMAARGTDRAATPPAGPLNLRQRGNSADDVRRLALRVRQLERQHREAVDEASYGKRRSVPGSLETWEARAAALAVALEEARAALAAAEARGAAQSTRPAPR